MYYVQCPQCGAVVELPDDPEEIDRSSNWHSANCQECDSAFEYHSDNIERSTEVEPMIE